MLTTVLAIALATAQQDGGGSSSLRVPTLGASATAEHKTPGQVAFAAGDSATVVSVKRIWSEAPHNGFTDLAHFRERWYCVFREGSARGSADGKIRLLTSPDGVRWQSAYSFGTDGADLRDPKLSVTSDDRLMLTAAAVEQRAGGRVYQTLGWYSMDGRSWGDPYKLGEEGVRLWRVSWNHGSAFSVGYSATEDRFVNLYTGPGGLRFRLLAERVYTDSIPTEATLLFNSDDTALCLLRRDGGTGTTMLGRARPPYRGWEWKDLGVRLTSPSMIRLPDGRIVVAGGRDDPNPRVSVHWLDEDEASLEEVISLPSGGDTGYPGLVFEDNLLWISYHSSHAGSAGIYLANVKLPELNEEMP